MRIWVVSLCLLLAAATGASFLFYNRWKHATRQVHTVSIDPRVLQKKLQEEAPAWVMRQIQEDLRPYESGISRAMLDEAFRGNKVGTFSLVRFVVHNGRLSFALDEKLVDTRHFREMLAFFKTLNQHVLLPNVEFIVSLEDGFSDNPGLGPCFVFAKNREEGSLILIPDIKAMAGYGKIRKSISDANRQHAWKDKIERTFWRGSTTGGHSTASNWDQLERAKLVLLSLAHPEAIDARFHHVAQCDPDVPGLMRAKGMVAPSVTRPDHLKYKYLVDVDGNSCSFERYFWLLLSNSLVIKQMSPNVQWYYGGLEPYRHFLPVERDLSNLLEQIEWAKSHDEECRQMSERASEFIRDNMAPEDTLVYLYHLLREYARLLR